MKSLQPYSNTKHPSSLKSALKSDRDNSSITANDFSANSNNSSNVTTLQLPTRLKDDNSNNNQVSK
eukprot:scaffold194185_cov16-Prasinocladus_malaysianus.AAC.1